MYLCDISTQLFSLLFVLFVWETPRGVVCTLRLTERIQLQLITQQTLVFQNIKFKVESSCVSKVANLSSSLKKLNRDICTYSTLMNTHIVKCSYIWGSKVISKVNIIYCQRLNSFYTHEHFCPTLSGFLKAASRVAFSSSCRSSRNRLLFSKTSSSRLNFPMSEVPKSYQLYSERLHSFYTHEHSVTFWKLPDELQPGSV